MKLKLAFFNAVLLIVSTFQVAVAQDLQISGAVKSRSTGEALNGATVTLKGTNTAVSTDQQGNFSLSAPQKGGVLIVSYSGMKPATYTLSAKTTSIVVYLEETTANEVVVVGYGSQKVTKVSGAVATVRGADIKKLNPVRLEEALQGGASGVNVIQSGSPGTKPTVLVRGIPSFGGNDPTIIVDGVQQTLDDLNAINPIEIESINVLKDAATTAIFGVKGGNGVIVVTTKSGRKNQKTDMNFSGTYGVQQVLNTIPMLNAAEYGAMLNEGSVASGGNLIFSDLSALGAGTDWQKEIFKNAPIQTYNLSAKGGSDKMSYFLSGGYLNQGGIVGGYDKSRFNRLNFTSNLSFDLTSKLKFIVNSSYVNFNGKGVQENSFNSILGSAINFDPTVPVYNTVANTVGQYGFSTLINREVFNPLTKLENTYNQNVGNKLYGKFELQYDVMKNFKITTRFGYTKYDGNSKSFDPLVFYGLNNVDNSLNADGSTVAGKHNSVRHEKQTYGSFVYELFGNYNFSLNNKHNFETTAGISLSKGTGNVAGASRQDVPFNSWEFADFTAATGSSANNNANGLTGYYYQYFNKRASGFGRVNYDYENKYLASFTARRDGSYAFGADNKFANFYSGALGWVASNEKFFHVDFIDYLKIRGSVGSVGNDNNINPKTVLATIQTDYLNSLYANGNSIGYTFGNIFYNGATVGSASNTALRWEKQIQSNIGFDMTFFKNKFSLTADYFTKKTDGLLFVPAVSAYLGTIPPPSANIGATKSSGIDMTFGYNDKITKDVTINTSLTVSKVKNLVTKTSETGAWISGGSYFNGQSQTVTIFAPGYAPSTYYGYQTDGLFQNAAEIASSPTQLGAQPGDIKFVDINNDGKIDASDRTVIGNPFPKVTLGWNLNISYKQFDFTAFTYASIGNDVYRAFERNDNYTNKYQDVLDRWTGEGSTNDAHNPRYSFTDPNNNSRVSDRFVEDGSFVKIKNLQLGYTLPESTGKKAFKSMRIYAQVKNAITFTKYRGFDPEIAGYGLLDTGIDRGAYPQARNYTIGVDIKF
jgi:hypothetical protein